MNVLPAPTTPPRSPATSGPPAGNDAPSGFASLLAGHVGTGATTQSADTPAGTDGDALPPDDVLVTDGPEAETAGAVAVAVHAAIAAWRADPADVALGAHLRQVLEGTVRAAAVGQGETLPADVGAPPGTPDATAEEVLPTATVGEGRDDFARPGPVALVGTVDGAPAIEGARPDVEVAGATGPTAPVPADPEGTPATPDASGHVETADSTLPTHRGPRSVETGARVAPTEPTTDASVDGPELAVRAPNLDGPAAAPRPSNPMVASAATLDRVMRAVEALEHAPPPRRVAIEVEGVRLTVAMRGEQVSVAVRTGAEQLDPGWQRDLAAALRGRGLGLAADPGTAHGQGHDRRHPPGDTGRAPLTPTRSTLPTRSTGPADPTGLRL